MAEEYTRGEGPDALQYGEATDLNQEAQFGRDVQAELAATQVIPDVQYDDTPEVDYTPAGEDEEILFGDPEGISMVHPGVNSQAPVPKSIVRQLPRMAAMVADPTTPPAIKAAYNFIIRRLMEERSR